MFNHKVIYKVLTLILFLKLIFLLIIYYTNLNNQKIINVNELQDKILKDSSINWNRYPKVPSDRVNRILILTQARSGSTFLGDLLQQSWPTFFSYEPLINMRARNPRNDPTTIDEAINMLIKLFKCDFFNLTSNYLSPVFWKVPYLHWNKVMRLTVGTNKINYFNYSINQFVCERSTNILIKVIRLGVEHFIVLNEKLKTLGYNWPPIKLIFLVRDPRAIMSSRNRMQWCVNSPNCTDIDVLCQRINNDIEFIKLYNSWSKGQITVIRYEDLCLNVLNYTKRLNNALNVTELTDSLLEWIKLHTLSDDILSNPHSTIRHSLKTAFQWTKRLDIEDVIEIQDVCQHVMNQLGYKLIHFDYNANQTKLENLTISDIITNDFVLNHLSP